MSTTITNLPETSKVNGSDYLVLDQSDKTVKSTVSNFLTDTGVVLATQLKDTDSGSSLVTYTNPNGPGVPMPLDVRIGQTYFMSDYGVSPSSTAEENTARINSVFSSLGGKPFITQFVFDCKGVVLINGSLLLKNNMDILIHAGTEIRNVAGTNRPVFISEYWFKTISNPSDLTQKSDYLGIRGGGIINYNKSGTAPGGLNTHAVCIAGVKRLKLGGGLKVGGGVQVCLSCSEY